MPFYQDGDFQNYITKRTKENLVFEESEILRFIANIVICVNHLNSKGIYRLDAKPSNYLISKKNQGKIYLNQNDFELAIELDNKERLNTSEDKIVGTM